MPPKIFSANHPNLQAPSHSGTTRSSAASHTDSPSSPPGSKSPALSGLQRREPGKQRIAMQQSGRPAHLLQANYNPRYPADIAANIQKGLDAWIQKNGHTQPDAPGIGLDQINKERVAWIQSRVQDAKDVIQAFHPAQKT